MDFNTIRNRQILINSFGAKLASDPNFKLQSAPTYRYNCIAFAMGMDDRWVDAMNLPWHWWPPVIKDQSPEGLITAFEYLGFEKCGMDDSLEEEYDKVVLYKIGDEWKHAAKIVDNNVYHSKFGESFDGNHSGNDVLCAVYGMPYQVMRRTKENAHLTDDLKGAYEGHSRTGIVIPSKSGRDENVIVYKGNTYLEFSGIEVSVRLNGVLRKIAVYINATNKRIL